MTTTAKSYHYNDVIKYDGDVWKVIGIGVLCEKGQTLMLASTTRFTTQKNGKRPIMIMTCI